MWGASKMGRNNGEETLPKHVLLDHEPTWSTFIYDDLLPPRTCYSSYLPPTLPPTFRQNKQLSQQLSWPSCHPKQPLRKHSWQEVISSHTSDGSFARHGIIIASSVTALAAMAIPILPQAGRDPPLKVQTKNSSKKGCMSFSKALEHYKAQVLWLVSFDVFWRRIPIDMKVLMLKSLSRQFADLIMGDNCLLTSGLKKDTLH